MTVHRGQLREYGLTPQSRPAVFFAAPWERYLRELGLSFGELFLEPTKTKISATFVRLAHTEETEV